MENTPRVTGTGREPTTPSGTGLLALFAVLVFLNAALLFVIQPMFTKMVLPLLGGTPAVWNTSMLFFQAALLLGYLYAHLTSRRWSPQTQGRWHAALLLAALVLLPIAVRRTAAPEAGGAIPVLWLLGVLAASLGVPFVLLAAGAPMFQRWFAATRHADASNPYVLYVASNLGSFAALLAYPLVIEPRIALADQRLWWRVGYGVLVVLVSAVLVTLRRWTRESDTTGNAAVRRKEEDGAIVVVGGGPPRSQSVEGVAALVEQPHRTPVDTHAAATPHTADSSSSSPPPAPVASTPSAPPAMDPPSNHTPPAPNPSQRLRWTLLAFAPSSLLLGVTTFISSDIAAVPLLWIVPLALYLLTFVIVFARRPVLSREFMLVFQLFVALSLLVVIGMTPTKLRAAHVLLHLLGFFATALVCHRALADSRPPPAHLTEFYLWMSFGGMLGGVFNTLLAPVLYDRVLEYPIAVIIALGLRPAPTPQSATRRTLLLDMAIPAALFAALVGAFQIQVPVGKYALVVMWTIFAIAGLIVASFWKRPLRLALAAAALFLAIDQRSAEHQDDLLLQTRSFFGVYRVMRWGDFVILQNGTTTHGAQSRVREDIREPLTYYTKAGPLGDAIGSFDDGTTPRQVAVIGLGAGTTACYARSGEQWDFYEIDPAMVQLATSGRLFSYMTQCAPNARILIGDARLRIADVTDRVYDLMIFDAFSSDAIPVHLMTREAVGMYLGRLAPRGVLLFHISNRYLDLEPVLAAIARAEGLASMARDHNPTQEERDRMQYASRWIAIARDSTHLVPLAGVPEWRALRTLPGVRAWTDDYSDIWSVFKNEKEAEDEGDEE